MSEERNDWSDREWLKDRLLMLLGRYQEARADSVLESHQESVEWLTREAREDLTIAERRELEVRAARFARRMMGRASGTALRVREFGIRPSFHRPRWPGTASQVLDIAAMGHSAPYTSLSVAAGAGRELWEEDCEEWVALPDDVGPGRYVALGVAGESMQPLLHPGDVLLIRIERKIERDTVVVAYVPDEGYVVKRVRKITPDGVMLGSLNPDFPDIRIPARENLVLGTLVGRWCAHGEQAA